MTGDCGGLIQHIAGNLVSDGWKDWGDLAKDAFNDVSDFFTDLENLTFTPINPNIDFDVDANLGTPFTKPLVPDDPDLSFDPVDGPGNIAIPEISAPIITEPPDFTGSAPVITLPTPPEDLAAEAPTDAPTIGEVTLPTAPVIVIPAEPTLDDITLPDVPDITLPAFTDTAPILDAVAPGNTFNFTYEEYSKSLPELQTEIQRMLAGGTGLPDVIWQALWDKARSREDVTAVKLVQEITDEWAARGFTLPAGVLDAKIEAARQQNQDAANQLSRDIAIQQAQMEQVNIQFAVTQGIAYENLLIGLHFQKMQLTYEVARFTLEAAISIFNAKIALYNAEMQGYMTEAQVYKTRIEAETINVELYRAQLEGQKLIGELNLQDIEIYKARLDALMTHIEVYKGELEGVKTQVDVDKTRVDAFKAQVEAYGEQVRARGTDIQAYAEQIRGEIAKSDIYEAEVNAFASLVNAYKTNNDAKIDSKRIELELSSQHIDKFRVQVEKYNAELNAEAKRVDAGTRIYDGKTRMYSAELSAEQARVSSDTRHFELALREAQSKADIEVKEAQMKIEELLRILSLELDKTKTLMSVQSQLAASALSAVNLSASVSESASNSTSCSTNYSYDQTAG